MRSAGTLFNNAYILFIFMNYRRTGVMRSAGPNRHDHGQHRHNPMKHKRKPPRGMFIIADDLSLFTSGPPVQAESVLKNAEAELVSLKRQVNTNFCLMFIISTRNQVSSGRIFLLKNTIFNFFNTSKFGINSEEFLLISKDISFSLLIMPPSLGFWDIKSYPWLCVHHAFGLPTVTQIPL
jgi:hypothetical protein